MRVFLELQILVTLLANIIIVQFRTFLLCPRRGYMNFGQEERTLGIICDTIKNIRVYLGSLTDKSH